MNFNQLKKLNSAMKSFIQQNTAKKTNFRIEELKKEIEEIKAELKELEAIENKTFDDLENIRMFNNLIKDCLKDIEVEENREGVPEFRSYKTIKREYTNQLIKKYKNESQEYQKYTNEYYENKKEHLIYEDDEYDIENNIYEDGYNDFNEFIKISSQSSNSSKASSSSSGTSLSSDSSSSSEASSKLTLKISSFNSSSALSNS